MQTEIELVQSIGVTPENIIYANPCKQISQIKYAAKNGVQMMTFDNEVELSKVSRNHQNAKYVLTIILSEMIKLLMEGERLKRGLGLNFVFVFSFYVGNG